jgi:hypothetical protein
VVIALAVLSGVLTIGAVRHAGPTSSNSSAPSTTTTVARERPQAGWAVASASGRGVMADFTTVTVNGARFRVVRMRARTTFLRWHVGLGDPALYARVPVDAGPSVDWPNEGPAGVVAIFNGGFKQAAQAGGAMADGLTLVAPTTGRMTIALDAAGHWVMGVWGQNLPRVGFHVVSYRQNLAPLVRGGAPTGAASGPVLTWGSPLGQVPAEPRTGLGVDRQGNLLYVATMQQVLPIQLATALVRAGALNAMELDINPFWPILGVPLVERHHPGVNYAIGLAGSQHSATVYDSGWIRDFFVALAEPSRWTCQWTGPGVHAGAVPQPQHLRRAGNCARVAPGHYATPAGAFSSR